MSPPSSGWKNKTSKKHEADNKQSHIGFFLGTFFDPEDADDVPPKHPLALNGLHILCSTLNMTD
jgi:hypothetical protein